MRVEEQRELSDFASPGWYMFVIVACLSILLYLSDSLDRIWLSIIFSVLWGFVAWASTSLLLWIIADFVPELLSSKEQEEKPSPIYRDNDLAKHIDKVINDVGLMIGRNSAIPLNDYGKQRIVQAITIAWDDCDAKLSAMGHERITLERLEGYGYITLSEKKDSFTITDKGRAIFPCHNNK